MELMQEIEQQGIKIHLIDAEHLALTPKAKVTPELIEKVTAKKGALIAALSGMGKVKNVDPGPDLRTVKVFSKVLNREVFISWQGENPQTLLFDGVAYTIDEIAKLKEMPLTPDDLRTIHLTKKAFEGEIEVAQDLTNYE